MVSLQVLQFLLPYANILWNENQDENENNDNQDPLLGSPVPEPPSRLRKGLRKKKSTNTSKRSKKSTIEVIQDDEDSEDGEDNNAEDARDDLDSSRNYHSTQEPLSDELIHEIFQTMDYELSSMEACPTIQSPKEPKKGTVRRSNRPIPEQQIPAEMNERIKQRTQKLNERGNFFNWEHVLCAVQQSAESILEDSSVLNFSDFEDGTFDDKKLEEMFFQAMNAAASSESTVQKSVEISPLLPPLHLTSNVVQRIQSRLVALFGMSRDTTPLHRSESSRCRHFDFCSPGYPQSS